jgi:hypothetical protein
MTDRPAGWLSSPDGLVDRVAEVAAERARQGADVFSYLAELIVPGHETRVRCPAVVVIHLRLESILDRWADRIVVGT